jgi:hypothetical protein
LLSTRERDRASCCIWFLEFAQLLALSFLIAAGARGQSSAAKAQIVEAIDPAKRITLQGNTPPFARAENDRGAAPDDLALDRMLLVLKRPPDQEAALQKLLVEQQVKSSPNYHQWLTPQQFGNQYGPADADIQAISDWLNSQGFQIDRVSRGRSIIEFSGSAGLVREAFYTAIHRYEVSGKRYWSNSSDPQIPAALAPVIAGIASLNNFPIKPMVRQVGFPVRVQRTESPMPQFTFRGPDGTVYYALTPADFDTVYNVPQSVAGAPDGQGETIAIVADSNVNVSDWTNFRNAFGLAAANPNVIVNGPDPGIVGDESEADLDMEWAGAIAPYATIDLVVSEDTTSTPGIDLSALYIVDNDLAPVMSESYGFCEASLGASGNAFFNSLWEQAAAQGISVVVAGGDSGSSACYASDTENETESGLGVSGVASTPFDLAVGGTDFDDASDLSQYWSATNNPTNHSSVLSYIPEITWNDSCAQVGDSVPCDSQEELVDAGGGGPSSCATIDASGANAACTGGGYAKPDWQTGAGVPSDSVRDVPDVSLFSGDGRNESFYLFCEADANLDDSSNCNLANDSEFEGAGGTSFAAQAFGAIMALVDQKTGARQGNPNYVLYTLAAQPGASCQSTPSGVQNTSCVFYDVINGNNSLPCGISDCGTTTSTGGTYVLIAPGSDPPVPAWNAGPGYDLATGLGSVNATNLIDKWGSVSFTPSTTQLTILPTTLAHGTAVTVNAQVTAQGGTPTGSVALLAAPNGSNLGVASFALTDGSASGTTQALPGGTYNVTAHYPGNGTYGASNSNPVQVTVSKESSVTSLGVVSFDWLSGAVTSTNATTFPYGSSYILRVSVGNSGGNACAATQVPGTGCPSGTVNLTDNGAPLNSSVSSLNSLGIMEDDLIQLSAGVHTLSASYLGDNSFNPSNSAPDVVTVTQAGTMTILAGGINSTVPWGTTVTLTATVSALQSNGAAPSGTVQFLSSPSLNSWIPISGKVSYSDLPTGNSTAPDLVATLATTLSSTTFVSAQYSGDQNYSSSWDDDTISVTPGFAVSVKPASVTIPAAGQSGSATVAVTSGGGFSGSVALSCQLPVGLVQSACTFSPPTVSTAGQSALTITTIAPQSAAAPFDWRFPSGYLPASLGLLCLASIMIASLAAQRRFRFAASLSSSLALSLVLFLCLAMTSCGSGGPASASGYSPPAPGTPAGTYEVVVTATSGTTSQQVNLSVTVQ